MTDTNGQCQRSADNIQIAYGKEVIDLKLPKPADVIDVVFDKAPLTDEKLTDILENRAIYSYGQTEIVEDANKILIVLPDSTRKSGAERILPGLMAKIEELGKEFHFIVAVGTHRPPSEDELKAILTPDIYEKHADKLIKHNSDDYDMHDYYGVTKRKTTVLINKAYREHDTIITIGSVSYHYFAGYGGGRKMIVPGLASKKTIMANHKLALDAAAKKRHTGAVTGNLRQNPVHDDIVDAIMIARSGHTFFAVNTLLNNEGELIDLTCGDLFMSHMKAAELLDGMSGVDASAKYDFAVLSAGGAPKDINMIQAQKSLDRIAPMLAEGAKVVFFARCPDGYGNKFFQEFFDKATSGDMLDGLIDDYQINRQTAYNLKTKLEAFEVYLYSDFTEEDCKRMGFKKLADPQEAVKLAENAQKTAFFPHAYNIFPR